jgi:hypothetical protein
MALAGLPGPRVLTLGISGEGSPQAGHAYTYLVSVDDTARAPGWLLHLDISAPAGSTVVAASGACRTAPGGASCVWPQLAGGSALGVFVTVSLAPGLRAGTSLIATARLSYDWGQLTDSATSVRTVSAPPPRPRVKPKPRPTQLKPKPRPTQLKPRPKPTQPRPEPTQPKAKPTQPRLKPRPTATPSPTHIRHPLPPPRPAPVAPLVTSPPPSRVSPASPPSQRGLGVPPYPVRPDRNAAPSRTPRPPPSRSPSARPLFPQAASQLIHPPPSLAARGLPKGLLIVLIIAPCVAAAVTRFARGR